MVVAIWAASASDGAGMPVKLAERKRPVAALTPTPEPAQPASHAAEVNVPSGSMGALVSHFSAVRRLGWVSSGNVGVRVRAIVSQYRVATEGLPEATWVYDQSL